MQGEHTYNIRTLFSGTFELPQGATLVSAVYDVSISKGVLEQPLLVELEHCVDVENDNLNTRKMSFAIGTFNCANKCYSFELKEGGSFTETMGTISVAGSCQICIVYTG